MKTLAEKPTVIKTMKFLPTASLVQYKSNPRKNDDQVDRMAALLREFGLRAPLLVHEVDGRTEVVDGHLRLKAATKLGIAEVPTVDVSDLSEAQIKALRLAMNKSAEFAEWDDELLAQELRAIEALGMGLDLTGFGEDELARLLNAGSEGLTDPDEVPEPPADPVSRLGDVWLLGRHRLTCGDCTDKATVDAVMNGKQAALCLTDPPYGIGNADTNKNSYDVYVDTKVNLTALINKVMPIAMRIAKTVVLTPGVGNHRLWPEPKWTMAWFTPAGAGSGPWGFCCWQPILCYGNDPKLSKGKGRHPDAVVHTESAEKISHPCSKPVNFWAWLMERTSEPGELLFEPFSGSGTSLIVAEKINRECFAIELSPAYVDVAVLRWQAFTGQEAILEATAQTFAELAADRGVVPPAGQLAGAA